MSFATATNTLILNKEDILFKGLARVGYRHPSIQNACVKIDHFEYRPKHNDTSREARYLRRIQWLRWQKKLDCFPGFYGFCQTNLGKGAVFELIRDADTGEISKSLETFGAQGIAKRFKLFERAFDRLIQTLLSEGLLVCDPNPGNIAVQELPGGKIRMVFIDGIGHHNFIPVVDLFKPLSRSKLQRIMKRERFRKLFKLMADARALSSEM